MKELKVDREDGHEPHIEEGLCSSAKPSEDRGLGGEEGNQSIGICF